MVPGKYQVSILFTVIALIFSTAVYLFASANGAQKMLQITGTTTSTVNLPTKTTSPSPYPTRKYTASPTPADTDTPVPTPTMSLTPSATVFTFDYPESFLITDITGHRQVFSLSCESAVAVDWAGYFDVPIVEREFHNALPASDNPEYGFVGDVHGNWGQIPPYDYGVHAGPVADLLVEYGLPAKSVKNYTLEEVKQRISESKPVIAWVIGSMEFSHADEFMDKEGRSVIVAPYEHTVIITGYDENYIHYMNNGQLLKVTTKAFLKSWGVLGNMAIVHE